MGLTEQQELEMYRNVGIIANNCIACKATQEDHEKRIRFLEKYYWIFFGTFSCIVFWVGFLIKGG